MTIAKNPRKKPRSKESKAETKARKFITPQNGNGKRDLQPVLVKFDRPFLERVDAQAKGRGLNRTSFIISTLADRLAQLEGE